MSEAINNSAENYETKLLDENQVKDALTKSNKITQADKIKIDHNKDEWTINVNINNWANAMILSFDGEVIYDLNEIKSIPNIEEKAKQQWYLVNKLPSGFLEILQIEKHGKPTNLEVGWSEYMTALSAIQFSQHRINTINKIQENKWEKIKNEELDEMIKQSALKPIDILILKEKWAIDEIQGQKYLDETIWYMLTNMAEWRINNVKAENNEIIKKLNWNEYHIQHSEFSIDELNYYKDSWLIWQDEYQIHIDFMKDMDLLDEEIKYEISKSIGETKNEISKLKDEEIIKSQ